MDSRFPPIAPKSWSNAAPQPSPQSSPAYQQGLSYLVAMADLAVVPAMVERFEQHCDRIQICAWIGHTIPKVNQRLQEYVQACDRCFLAESRPQVQIFAVPIAQSFGVDGVCNLATTPITLLLDLGQVAPSDWLGLVMHEYAHAQVGNQGHDLPFGHSLTHLCLGLGLAPPSLEATQLQHWPYCPPTPDPLEFWRGHIAIPH